MSTRPFDDDELRQIERLAAMPDEDIDTSDIPEITDAQWATAQRGSDFRPFSAAQSIRVDPDLLIWFKNHAAPGKVQEEINRVLRRHVGEAAG